MEKPYLMTWFNGRCFKHRWFTTEQEMKNYIRVRSINEDSIDCMIKVTNYEDINRLG